MSHIASRTIGLLLSGGLDSAILLEFLLTRGRNVQPFYIDCGLFWQTDELRVLRRYLRHVGAPHLCDLVTLNFPLADVYEHHWSITGRKVPTASSPDQKMFLPSRNVILVTKAALWCQLHGIHELALATLSSNPFPDATPQFFQHYETALSTALSSELRIIRPFAHLEKRQVMELGRDLPLELTFSCVAPVRGQHCGECNKCAERQAAFRLAGTADKTVYVHQPQFV